MAVEAILSTVIGQITKLAAPPVIRYLRPIWGGVDGDLEKLLRYLQHIKPLVQDAEERQLMEDNVKSWLMLLKDAVYDAEDILDQANTHVLLIQRKAEFYGPLKSKVRDFFSLHHNPLLFQLQLGHKLRSINQRIHVIIVEMREFNFKVADNNNKNDRPWRNRPQTHSYVPESEVIGRDEDREKIVQMLIHDQFEEKVAVVSIVGMGGLGKTTLAQLIYGDENVKNHFQLCIWVCVSDDFDVAKLARNIMLAASKKSYADTNMEVLQQDLRQVLGLKTYLLVLDDVWNEDHMKWDALRHLLLDGAEGSRILVTTRNENCSRIMGAKESYLLQGLSEEKSWALFERTAFTTSVSRQPKFLEIGKKIVNKCKGLPLAIQVMGSLMQSKIEESQWQAVLDNEIWDIPRATDKIRPELWLSYVNLPSEVKKCFAFCALFPKDSVIEVDMLVQFWIAHGFIPSQTGKDIDVEGHEIFSELIWRSLLQNVTDTSAGITHYYGSDNSYYESENSQYKRRVCKMHDLMHDLAQFVTGDECSTLPKRNEFKKISKRTRHFILKNDVEYDMGDRAPALRTALPVGTNFIGLSKLKLLRVLKLHPYDTNVDKLLSTSIEYLHHLRNLNLAGTDIRELPESICMLVNLQTLNLNYCRQLTKLPMSIVYMNSLRHLHLNDCPELKIMPSGLSRLRCLKTLTKYIVSEKAGNKIGELKHWNLEGELGLYDLHEVKNADEAKEANMSSRQNINSLSLSWGWGASVENAEQVLEALKPHAALKELSLYDYPGTQFSMWIRDRRQLQNLVKINLKGCKGCEQLPPLEQLPYLGELIIDGMDGIKYIINNTTGDSLSLFPALRTLRLYKMANLKGWCVEEDRETAPPMFPRLQKLFISRCPKLITMPPQIPTLKHLDIKESYRGTQIELVSKEKGFFKHLKSLESLSLTRCEELALLLEDKEETRPLSSSLRSLSIFYYSQFSLSAALRNLTSLKSLRMYYLEKLSSWPDEMLRDSESLRHLTLTFCNNLTGASSQGDCGPPFLESLNVSYFDALIELPKCPTSLKSLYVHNCPSIKSLCSDMGHLTSLSQLSLSKCPKLESLPEGMQGLTSLQYLSIEDCPALKLFPEGLQQQLPTLERLKISGCPKLERRCSLGGDYFHLVSSISERYIKSSPRRTLLAPCL
ncbi:P-loop containing nucleoside triphosphate hydrolase protein [Dioscorea alata]|uniref:P-loop containing nucleoside triphosphate hydrolase protein n=3 Tax=Dioscorea alata TaxID=55571 RepID=A0ACB7WLG7_DIOAL|nr:P-loop containing nucleoside triphosphate hydrolase protein [Dioscorea alata]KAH7688970.1 P-loop containing nucleoside triphosphate hydrolase protein [Dioscorea alata]KAH7688971.1 P-loop containing nucleoside triphosphate hydrolase protein [Dioscorea alata]